MAAIGRPPIGPEIKTRLTVDEIADLGERAVRLGIDRSELVRRYIRSRLRDDACMVALDAYLPEVTQ